MRKYNLSINNNSYEVVVNGIVNDQAEVEVNGKKLTVSINDVKNMAVETIINAAPKSEFKSVTPTRTAKKAAPVQAPVDGAPVTAPIPGQIKGFFVKVGDKVEVGDKVLVMEAMKMENIIAADVAGTVAEILVGEGDAVTQDQALIVIGG